MRHLLASLAMFLLCPVSLQAQKPLTNADIIEMSRAGVPQGTIITDIQNAPVNFDVSPQALIALNAGGVNSAVLNQMITAGARRKYAASFGVATGTFPVKDAAGKTVRYSGWIKTENVADGYAGLWWRVDGEQKTRPLAFDNSQARYIGNEPASGNGTVRGATGTTSWTRFSFDLPVPANATNINFGALLTGTGTAWFDALQIELDNVAYSNPQAFDLGFELPTAKGFYTGGNGYRVSLDKTASYTGSQSLKMLFIGDGSQPK